MNCKKDFFEEEKRQERMKALLPSSEGTSLPSK